MTDGYIHREGEVVAGIPVIEAYNDKADYWHAIAWRLCAVAGAAHDGSPNMEEPHYISLDRSRDFSRKDYLKSHPMVVIEARKYGGLENCIRIDIAYPKEVPNAKLAMLAFKGADGFIRYELLTEEIDGKKEVFRLMRALQSLSILERTRFSCDGRDFIFTEEDTQQFIEISELDYAYNPPRSE